MDYFRSVDQHLDVIVVFDTHGFEKHWFDNLKEFAVDTFCIISTCVEMLDTFMHVLK